MARRLSPEELLIPHPESNPDEPDVTGYSDNTETFEELRDVLQQLGVTVFTHPNVIDLGSGRGSIAKLLSKLNWIQRRIVCVDRFAPRDPLVELAPWMFFNVDLLISILSEQRIPQELESDEGKFDVLITAQTKWTKKQLQILAAFFLFTGVENSKDITDKIKVVRTKHFTIIIQA